MKKITITVLILTILVCASLPVSAQETDNVLTIDNVEYIFEDNLTYEEQLQLIDAINRDDNGVETCGLWCTLFGHDYEEQYVTTVTHGVNSAPLTCLEERFIVSQCTRCDTSSVERTGYNYIYCECGT